MTTPPRVKISDPSGNSSIHESPEQEAPSGSSESTVTQPQQPQQPAAAAAEQAIENAPAPGRSREKKRVGFLSEHQPSRGSSPAPSRSRGASPGPSRIPNQSLSPLHSPILRSPTPAEEDYFGYTPVGSAGTTPTGGANAAGNRDSLNTEALKQYLSNILPQDVNGPGAGLVSRPRPVLRKHTIQESPHDEPSTQRLQSEVEAKARADRLASALGSPSAPASERSSLDEDDKERGQHQGDGANGANKAFVNPFGKDGSSTHDFAARPENQSAGLRPRRGTNAHRIAQTLVRSHTTRNITIPAPEPVPLQQHGHTSGTATPVAFDLEYVPKPQTYQGGILSNLLELYNTTNPDAHSLLGSGTDTSAPSTPSRTPRSSPPTSGPTTPRLDPRRNFWSGIGRKNQSTSTLAGLVGSSATLAAPGSAKDISNALSEKIHHDRQDRERTKKHKRSKSGFFKQKLEEEYRITNHIAEILSRQTFVVKLCRALMLYGAPTHRLEAYMAMTARALSIQGQFLYLPGTMIISFDDSRTHTTEVRIVKCVQGVDLGRLRDVHEVYKEVVHDMLGVEEATMRLDELARRKPKFSTWTRILLYGVASAVVCPFGFDGRYIDMPIAFLLGILVGWLALVATPNNELYANVFEISASVLTSFLSRAFGSISLYGQPRGKLFCFSALAQSSIALILPGYMVLCSSLELQSHQIVAGSVRMVYALIYSLFLGYGITIGTVLYGYADANANSDTSCTAYNDHWYEAQPSAAGYLPFVFIFTICLCAINQAHWKQTPVMVLISLAGYSVNKYSSSYFANSSLVCNSLGSLTIGVLANLYSRLGRYCENACLDVWEQYLEPYWHIITGQRRPKYVYAPGKSVTPDPEQQLPKEQDDGKSSIPLGAMGAQPARGDRNSAETTTIPVTRHARKIGYGLAAAAMLPAIFVMVPSGLAVQGSLLSGVASANQITRSNTSTTTYANGTTVNSTSAADTSSSSANTQLNSTAFNVLASVIQVAISISVGLSLSALIVYPFGKRRSGLFSL